MLEEEMLTAANNLEFEKAADLRDRIKELQAAAQPPSDAAPQDSAQFTADKDAEHQHALAAAIDEGIANRLANRPTAKPQQTKFKRGPKRRH